MFITSGKTKRADHLVMMYIVNDMRPLSTVSRLCQSPDMQIMCRKTLQIQINTYYDEIVSALSLKLKSMDYLCLTADCWSSHARAFPWSNMSLDKSGLFQRIKSASLYKI
ncbi:hypothetical protein Ocin01_19101 [Orchesella cincta]|uniref:AC transposase n=1 Tax=Orchesella cincta TaxID=48709 RepID=A0A1D2M3N9_ORCCI|nr:hypothetical protein Ocin01_19101 [Orchesella cincta]